MNPIYVIDSHTGGEPTRTIVSGGPDLGSGTMAERLDAFRSKHDQYRSAIVDEPRGSGSIVGALLCESSDPSCHAGVIFFNNVGYLGMCGHGVIGVVKTMQSMGRIKQGTIRIETPVGVVSANLAADDQISVENVASYRHAWDVSVEVPGVGEVRGDVAWGGNWFYLVTNKNEALSLNRVPELSDLSRRIRSAVNELGFLEVDHIELFGPPSDDSADSRNFVLCPGGAYDRSPCGTGTSAKLACLASDGRLEEGEAWVQEGIVGSSFTGSYRWIDRERGRILPTITGTAHITSNAELMFDESDPFRMGMGD